MDTTLLDLMFFDLFFVIEAFIEEIHPALKDEYYENVEELDGDFGFDDYDMSSGIGTCSEIDDINEDVSVSELEDNDD